MRIRWRYYDKNTIQSQMFYDKDGEEYYFYINNNTLLYTYLDRTSVLTNIPEQFMCSIKAMIKSINEMYI